MSQFQQPPTPREPNPPTGTVPEMPAVHPQQTWYPPPPQFYEYQPQSPPSYQPTPPLPSVRPPQNKRRERKEMRVAISILLAVLLVLGAIGVFAYATSSKSIAPSAQATQAPTNTPLPTDTPTPVLSPTPTPTEAPTQPPTPTPTPNPHGDVGVTNSVGLWEVTLNQVYTSTGTQYFTPKPGNIYVVLDITAQNHDASSQLLADGVMFIFQDQTGQAYDETFVDIGKSPEGTVPANSKLRGQIVYEVSKSLHSFTLTFQDSAYNGNTATWNINV